MTSENCENLNDYLNHIQTDINHTMSINTYTVNMNLKLIDNSIAEFFENMDLRIIRELSLCFNRLPSIPNNFSQHLSNLERLDLSNNCLKELPTSFNLLTKLKHLKIDHNELQSLPKVLAGIRSLKSLSILHNKIEEISEELGNLINLEILDLSSNNLSELPYSFATLNRLKELNLAENNYNIIPECIINGMRNLEVLDLSRNKSIKLNVPPCSKRLKKFYAMENGVCRTFPRWLLTSKFSEIEEINLNGTEFLKFRFPGESALLYLRSLSITQSTLSENIINKLTRNMIKLEILDVSNDDSCKAGNIFCTIPIQQLKNPQLLKKLYLQNTGLPMISRSVNALCNITLMNLSNNRISWLPNEFCQLRKLETLIIVNNGLSILPDNFGNLSALKELIAGSNKFSHLPASMNKLKELRLLDLYDNDFSEIPWDVVNLENLQGLDLEYNFFSTENLMIRDVPYAVLRKLIHKKYMIFIERTVGTKVHQEESEAASSVSSNSSVRSEYNPEEDENLSIDFLHFNERHLEENWSLSDDSTENFQPHFVSLKRYQGPTSIIQPLSDEHFFCPGDSHSTPVITEVIQMRNDAIEQMSNFEEGQFDDA